MHTLDQLVTSKQAADMLGVHRATIARYVEVGLLEPVSELGGTRLFARADIETFEKPLRGRPVRTDR